MIMMGIYYICVYYKCVFIYYYLDLGKCASKGFDFVVVSFEALAHFWIHRK